MQTLFENVLTASLYGSVIIAALLLARPLLKKLPKKYLCLLWLLAFLRLLMPFEIPFDLSLQPDMTAITPPRAVVQPTIQDLPEPVPAVPEDAALPEDVEVVYSDAFTPPESIPEGLEGYYPPAEEVSEPLVIDWNKIGFFIWAAVACGLVGYSLISYVLLKRRVREAVHCRDGVWECAGLETAFILGWVRPRVYLPMGLTGDTRHHILRHEKAHLKRKDHWLKLLGFLALAVHWFNPLMWAAWVLLCRDMELACDEQVVKDMGLAERKDYSAALLRCSTRKEHYFACPVAFGEVSVKTRILSVLNYRRPRFWISVVGILAILFVAVFLMTSPAEEEPDLSFLNYKNAVSLAAEQKKVMAIYCVDNSICPGEVWGDDLAKLLDTADWRERRTVPRDQSSPGSIEFIIEDDYRITLFDRKFARVKYREEVRYYRIPQETYEYAVELLTNPEERILTEEEILIERCESAMEAVMYADCYHIAVSADLLRVPSSLQTYYEAEYWKSYENRLGKYTPDDDISTAWRMEWNGQTYKKQEEDDPYGWREEDFLEIDENRLLPWFHEVDWNRDRFSVEHHEVFNDTEEITLHHIQRDFYQPEYTMTFLLDKNGKLLRIDRKWVMYQGQACEGIYTTEFISFDPEEVTGDLEQIVEENPAVFTATPQAAWPGYQGTTDGYVYCHTTEREKKWEDDILYLAEAMLAKHPLLHDGNAYIYHGAAYEEVEYSNAMFDPAKRQAFIDGVNMLIPQLPQMTDEHIPFEINRVMALTGDGNATLLCNPQGIGLPLSIEPIWSGEQVSYHIVRIPEEQHNLLFGELTAINNKSIEEITNSLKSYVAYSNERWAIRWLTGMDTYSYLTARGALEAAGVVNANADTAEITVQTDAGSQTVTLPFLNLEEQMQMPRAFGHLYGTDLPPYRYLDERNIWCETWEDAVHLQIIEIPQGTNELEQELNKTIRALRDAGKSAKLIIDLRIGAIGDDMISRFKSFASRVNDMETDGVYILIDSLSQHHAPATAYRLKQWIAGSILVGSPTGHPINRFVSSSWDPLPNSKLFFSINEKYAYLDESFGNAVLQPDVLVQQTLADYKNGIDTVLEYVLSVESAHPLSSEEEILIERCQSAMEAVMYADSYHIAVSMDYTGSPFMPEISEAEYWKYQGNRLSRHYPDSDTATSWLMEWSGNRFKKLDCATWVSPDLQPYDWTEAEFNEIDENRILPWFHTVDWNRDTFSVSQHTVSGDTEEIILEHSTVDDYGDQSGWTMTFRLDKDGKLLSIDRALIEYNGLACAGTITTKFFSFDPDEVYDDFLLNAHPPGEGHREKLLRCYSALAWHQVQDSRHTRMHVFLTGDMVTEGEMTAEYWHTPLASARKVSREEGSEDDGWLVEKNRTLYCKGIKRGYPEDITDYTTWVEAVDTEENVMTTWLEEYRWDFSQIEFLGSEEQGERTVIRFRVNEVITDNLGGSAEDHIVTFCVNKDNKLLWAADNYAILGTLDGDAYGYMVSAEIQVLTYDGRTVTKDLEETLAEIQFPY